MIWCALVPKQVAGCKALTLLFWSWIPFPAPWYTATPAWLWSSNICHTIASLKIIEPVTMFIDGIWPASNDEWLGFVAAGRDVSPQLFRKFRAWKGMVVFLFTNLWDNKNLQEYQKMTTIFGIYRYPRIMTFFWDTAHLIHLPKPWSKFGPAPHSLG